MVKFADYYNNEDSKVMGDCEELKEIIERLSGWVLKRQENFRIKNYSIIHMRQNRANFTDTVIGSDLFTTDLERHLRIKTTKSIKTLAEHSVRI